MTRTTVAFPDDQSPFDAIKSTDEHGDHWRGRQLMPNLDYTDWRNFQRAIKQARTACAVELGEAAAQDHFVETTAMVPTGSGALRSVPDYRLTRAACYMTAMRGDANKPAIAKALVYFAARARQAELMEEAASAGLPVLPRTMPEALRALAAEMEQRENVQAELAEVEATNRKLSPKAARADQYEANPGITPTVFHKTYFSGVTERHFFEHLYRKDYLIDQRNARWDERKQEWKPGPEHLHPTAKGKRYFYLQPTLDGRGVRRQQTLVIPGDAEHDLVAALERDGLPSLNRPAIPGADVVHLPRQMRGEAS